MPVIELDLIQHQTRDRRPYQHLHIHLTHTQISLEDLKGLSFPQGLEPDRGIVLEGRAPIWLYGYLTQYCQHLPWIACYEPRLLGAVVAVDRTNSRLVGQVFPLDLPVQVFRKTQPESSDNTKSPVTVMNAQLQLQVTELTTVRGNCQTIAINIANRVDPDAIVSLIDGKKTLSNLMPPQALATLELPDSLNPDQEVILFGSGPPWLYVHLLERCRSASWVGFYDLRTKQVIVTASQRATIPVGTGIPVIFNRTPGLAILIGGPPDSGKSVLSNALRRSLTYHCPYLKLYLHRANWDGESNASYEMPPILAKQLATENEIKLDRQENAAQLIHDYFQYHADAIANIRTVMDIVLVDVGGLPQPEKAPVVAQCTHYIVISSKPDRIQEWHDLCAGKLEPVFIIHSKLEPCFTVVSQHPHLEVEAGSWLRGKTQEVPQPLLDRILNLIQQVLN
ncbi:CRISPR-associated ring nuclease Crn3/Csx3 [Pantanalinema rosaneae CENA516]|uniref:CRISPR-associated ring nuclease Crn3/Csx3 n=1 Tax=Pantanalinema rosaneae TaxID=1620701 RepID=UPI003D6FFC55